MGQGRWVSGEFAFVTEEKALSLKANTAGSGDVLFTQRGTLGQVAIAPPDGPERYLVSQSQMKLTVDESKASPLFVYYVFSSRSMQEYIRIHAIQTGVPHINLRILREIPIPLPPIEEQRAIAATLGALDDKIESNRRATRLMEELCRSHFERLFDTRNVVDGVPLSELFEVNPSRSLPSGQMGTYIGMASLPEFSAAIHHWEERPAGSGQRFQNGDVLMARITPCLENGKTAIVDVLSSDEVGWGSTEYIVLAPKALITTEWIYCLVRTDSIRAFAVASMTGTSGRQRFRADRFDQYKVVPPNPAALDEFNTRAVPSFARITQLRNETLALAALRDALLPELLSGRIRVPIEESVA